MKWESTNTAMEPLTTVQNLLAPTRYQGILIEKILSKSLAITPNSHNLSVPTAVVISNYSNFPMSLQNLPLWGMLKPIYRIPHAAQ